MSMATNKVNNEEMRNAATHDNVQNKGSFF